MPPQQLLLSWKDHNGALVSVFESLLKRNTLVDCTLAADGQYLKAHKVVLSACSSYFELLFSQESEKNPIVILKDVKFQELRAAVKFMYQGEVEVSEDRLAAFLEVADSLQIKGLGSDGKTQDSRKSPPQKSSKVSASPKAHSRKEVTSKKAENTGESCITLDSDENSKNESSSFHQLPLRETSVSSPIPSSQAVVSSFSTASASTSCPVRTETRDGDKREKNQHLPSSVSIFPLRDTAPSNVNNVIKSEPVTDTYVEDVLDETKRDFDDVTMTEDQEDWEDPNVESMGDDHSSSQHDPGYSVARMKTEETEGSTSEHMADAPLMEHNSSDEEWVQGSGDGGSAPQFASVFFKEHPPGLDPGPSSSDDPVPGPSQESSAATLQGGDVAGPSWRRTPPLMPRGGRYQCGHCGYATHEATKLARHQLVHTGERPFKCRGCPYATTELSNLKVHMRKHTGEKPYACLECGKRFAQSRTLKTHLIKFHGMTPN